MCVAKTDYIDQSYFIIKFKSKHLKLTLELKDNQKVFQILYERLNM
jgi:hypothetical protein